MKFGLHGINMGVCSEPEAALRVARAAEAAGFDSVWTAEHVVLPDPQAPPSPAPPHTKLLDPAVALAFIAAQTKELRLATGIIILRSATRWCSPRSSRPSIACRMAGSCSGSAPAI